MQIKGLIVSLIKPLSSNHAKVYPNPQEQLLKHHRGGAQVTSRHRAGAGEEHGGDLDGGGASGGDGGSTDDGDGPMRMLFAPPLSPLVLDLSLSMDVVLE